MSMNLHCDEMELYQTPTKVTYECIQSEDDSWEVIRDRYIAWVRSQYEKMPRTTQEEEFDYKDKKEWCEDHISELLSFDKLTFWII